MSTLDQMINCRKMILGHTLPSAPMHCLGFRWARKAKQKVCWWSAPASPAQELSQLARLCSIFLGDPATMGLCPRSLLVKKKTWRESFSGGATWPSWSLGGGTWAGRAGSWHRKASEQEFEKTFFQVVVGRFSGRSGLASLLLVQSTCCDASERQGRMLKNKNDILNWTKKIPWIKCAVDCERSGCLVLELLLYHHLHYKVLFNHNSPFFMIIII